MNVRIFIDHDSVYERYMLKAKYKNDKKNKVT